MVIINMAKSGKRSCIMIMAVFSMLFCLFITDMPFTTYQNTVYAADEGLTVGDSGDDVIWLQESLNELLDAGLTVDGNFGESTEKAVMELQDGHGIHPDGVADKVTIMMIKELLKKKRRRETTTTAAPDSTVTTSESIAELLDQIERFPEPSPYDIRNIPAKKEGHLFGGYWSEYFITLKDVVFHPKATLAPVKEHGPILFILCAALILWGVFFSLPIVAVTFVHSNGQREPGFAPIISENFYKFIIKLIGVIIVLMPFFMDTDYIRMYSYAGWVPTILIAIIFLAIRIALGFIAGGLILCLIYFLLYKISDEFAVIAGLIPGVAVFMLFYFLPWLMQMWRVYNI